MKISEIKLRFEAILTPLSSKITVVVFEFKYKVTENSDVYISVQRCRCVLNKLLLLVSLLSLIRKQKIRNQDS